MLADWRQLSSNILESLKGSELDLIEKLLMRDVLISSRMHHLNPEPNWTLLSELPLANGGSYDLTLSGSEVSFKDRLHEVSVLVKYLAILSLNLFSSKPNKDLKRNALTAIFTDGFSERGRIEFNEFINEKRFHSIVDGRTLIVQDRKVWKTRKIGQSFFVKDAGLFFFRNLLSRREKLALILGVLYALTKISLFSPFGYLGIAKLVIEKPLWNKILCLGLEMNYIATNSYMEMLPTPFYFHDVNISKRYLLWYSNNNFPTPTHDGNEFSDNRIDFSCRSDVDVHLVWTSDFADCIRQRNSTVKIEVVGSMMMYPKKSIETLEGFFRLILFDMTPWEGDSPNMYGSELFMQSFLEDIIAVSQSFLGIKIFLKPKRDYVREGARYTHSQRYLDVVTSFETKNQLKTLSPKTNIYGLCGQADLILAFPFASPAIIGHELSKPSFYYNPEFSKDWKIRKSMDNVFVISGKENLRLKIQEIYKSKNSRFNQC